MKEVEGENLESEEMNGKMVSEDEESTRSNDITKKLFKIFELWEGTVISCETFLSHLSVIAVEKIEFKTNWERRKLTNFAICVLDYMKEEEENGNKIKGRDIKYIKNII